AQIEDDLIDHEPAALVPAATVRELAVAAVVDTIDDLPVVEAVEPTEAVEATALAVEADGVDAFEVEAGEPIQWWAAQPIGELIDEPSLELDEAPIDLSGDLEGLSEQSDGELFDGDPVGVYTISAEADEPQVDALDLLPSILEPEAIAEPIEAPIAAAPAIALELTEPLFDETLFAGSLVAEPPFTAPAPVESVFVEPPEPPRADIQPWVPMYLTPGRMWPAMEGMPAETPAPRTEQPDWIELVASLRQDLERRRTDPAAPADPIAARPSDGAHAVGHQLVKKPRVHARKAKPVQDEWGFFDPEQCGFSTLLAKLNEITADT
ncbi:MAG: hypothetical protein ABJC89_27230, partial [Acidobacteriota bacterium]